MNIASLHIMDHFCLEITKEGIATWNIEYRRVGDPGGGWPGTFKDVGNAIDHLINMAEKYNLDLSRVVFIGHSSGGHLALWAGARHCLSNTSLLYTKDALKPIGIVSLAGLTDLRDMVERTKEVCGSDVIKTLVGGSFEEVPNRYSNASPITLLPTGIDQILVYGADDPAVPAELGQSYIKTGKSCKENIGLCIIPKASHFELIAPWTSSWPIVQGIVKSLIFVEKNKNIKKP
jgi:pimeloyl-ACP methyl ester carboxylesterase